MPFALIIIGLSLLVSGVKNTQDDLYGLIKSDFTGQNNYIYWAGSILLIGSVGYIDDLKPVANSFLTLLVIVLLLGGNKGQSFFERITAALNSTETLPSTASVSSTDILGMPGSAMSPVFKSIF